MSAIQVFKLSELTKGWFVGDFSLTVLHSDQVEVAVKTYTAGTLEQRHLHKVATEAADGIVLAGIGFYLAIHGLNAAFDVGEVIQQLSEQHPHGRCQVILLVRQMPPDIGMEAASADSHGQSDILTLRVQPIVA